jgi:hypothetical protein
MAQHPLASEIDALKADARPCVSDAAKNFISVLSAADLVAQPDDVQRQKKPHELAHLAECAKVVLRCINAHELPTPEAWALTHPQGDEESGADRIQALAAFRACHALRAHAVAALGAEQLKLTKLVGRRYLRATRCWEDGVGDAAAAELARLRFPPHTVSAFLDGWREALSHEPAESGADADADEADDALRLVWAADFGAAVRARARARVGEVHERRERMEAGDDEAEALREALAAAPDEMQVDHLEPRVVEIEKP